MQCEGRTQVIPFSKIHIKLCHFQVEIKAFLYNLNIQKKSINALNEINDIKHFLEQLSLVHCNTSLSLRDDANNEIILKIHKNRDIYQTLGSLYGIKKTDLQELKVEKNQYKVVAFIGKRDAEINQKRWVFLNGKVVHNGKLQSIINDNLSKSLKLNFQKKRKVKSKVGNIFFYLHLMHHTVFVFYFCLLLFIFVKQKHGL